MVIYKFKKTPLNWGSLPCDDITADILYDILKTSNIYHKWEKIWYWHSSTLLQCRLSKAHFIIKRTPFLWSFIVLNSDYTVDIDVKDDSTLDGLVDRFMYNYSTKEKLKLIEKLKEE